MQRQIRHDVPFQVPAKPRIYLVESKFGPKHAPRLKKAAKPPQYDNFYTVESDAEDETDDESGR
jgi:hypothetical protein